MLGCLDAHNGVSMRDIVVLLTATPLQSKALRAQDPENKIDINTITNILTVDRITMMDNNSEPG